MFCFPINNKKGRKRSNMIKQFLNKFPRKSSKQDQPYSTQTKPGTKPVSVSPCNNPNPLIDKDGHISTRSNQPKRVSTSTLLLPTNIPEKIEPLPSFKDVPETEQMSLFVRKLRVCCATFDFIEPNKDQTEKDVKRQTLLELHDFVSSYSSSKKFSDAAILAMCRMCVVNLFRIFPPNYRSKSTITRGGTGTGPSNDEEEPTFDPAWPHLQIVYDLFLRFIASPCLDVKIAKKYIDQTFILRLLDLFDTEDPRERECVKTVMHRCYGKFMVHRPFIRKAISNIFYRFVFETERHNGIAELLEIFGSVISGFALPLKEEHKMFLVRVLIPLHKPKCLGIYFQQLSYCVIQFIEKDPKLASVVIKGLLRYWPITNSQKEVMFLSEFEEILENSNLLEFQKVMIPFFFRIGSCMNSFHFQVAERALLLWNNDHIMNLVAHNVQVIMPIIYPALEKNIKNHWNQAVLHGTLTVRTRLSNMDQDLFFACRSSYREKEEASKLNENNKERLLEHATSLQNPMMNETMLLW